MLLISFKFSSGGGNIRSLITSGLAGHANSDQTEQWTDSFIADWMSLPYLAHLLHKDLIDNKY